jgi:hypothetical protein
MRTQVFDRVMCAAEHLGTHEAHLLHECLSCIPVPEQVSGLQVSQDQLTLAELIDEIATGKALLVESQGEVQTAKATIADLQEQLDGNTMSKGKSNLGKGGLPDSTADVPQDPQVALLQAEVAALKVPFILLVILQSAPICWDSEALC